MNRKAKTAKRGTGKKKLARWKQRMLEPEVKPPVFVALEFNEQGDVRAVTLDQAQQTAAQLKALDDQAKRQVWKEAETIRRKNPQLLDKQAQDALSCLFIWAVMTKQYRYGDWLSPDDQREMLDDFGEETDESIKRAEFKKAESEIITEACRVAEPYLIDFSKGISKANDPQVTPKQQRRKLWRMIASDEQWALLIERHMKESIQKHGEGNKARSHDTLRNGVRLRLQRR
jgi:hypothetical protein